jgi:hypothetical protein
MLFFGATFLQGILLNKYFYNFLDFLISIFLFLIRIKLCQQILEVGFSTFKEAQSISGKISTPNTRASCADREKSKWKTDEGCFLSQKFQTWSKKSVSIGCS